MMRLTTALLLSVAAVAAITGSAMAADLMVPMAPAMAPPAPSAGWDGLYVGLTAGYSWGTVDDALGGSDGTAALSGGFLGAQIGYNFHITDNVLLGIQGDLNWSNESTGEFSDDSDQTARINWDGAVMARLGLDAGQFVPYVEAGVAFANINVDETDVGEGANNQTQTGWAAGVGVQFMLADRLSANLEYRYADYGRATFESGDPTIGTTDSSIRIGIDYHM